MVKPARSIALVLATFAAATAAGAAASRSAHPGLTVHEWGTFTTVAGPDGRSVYWQALSGPQDLPCFVTKENPPVQVKGFDIVGLLRVGVAPRAMLPAKVRMETPVLYFYSPSDVTVNVKVSFQQGVMSEWYPKATAPRVNLGQPLETTTGTIEWPAVRVRPGASVTYPQGAGKSRYYAARDVDADPLEVGDQHEKFLFYRGLADFQPPLAATMGASDEVTVTTTLPAPHLVLFENRSGQIRYRIARETGSRMTLAPPLTGTLDGLRADLEAMLTAEGLYRREAKAMVETWRDSWFEEGTRIIYLFPKASVDERLPLTISPAPADVARVFVGRLELVTPEMKDDVERAIVTNDLDALNRYGRFLDTIVWQLADRPSISQNPTRVANALRAVAMSHPQNACQ